MSHIYVTREYVLHGSIKMRGASSQSVQFHDLHSNPHPLLLYVPVLCLFFILYKHQHKLSYCLFAHAMQFSTPLPNWFSVFPVCTFSVTTEHAEFEMSVSLCHGKTFSKVTYCLPLVTKKIQCYNMNKDSTSFFGLIKDSDLASQIKSLSYLKLPNGFSLHLE